MVMNHFPLELMIITKTEAYTPVIVDTKEIIQYNPIDNWEQLINELTDDFITSNIPNTAHYKNIQESRITQIYMEVFDKEGVADFDSIMCDVFDYNHQILLKIAEIDFANNYAYPGLGPKEYLDEISELEEQWQQDLFMMYFSDLEDWVMENLNNLKFAYYEPQHRDIYNHLPKKQGIRVIYNECQNILNKEWMTDVIENLDYLIYDNLPVEKVQVVNIDG